MGHDFGADYERLDSLEEANKHMKYATTRLIVGLLATIVELWLAFYFGSRPWFEQWAQMALLWQILLTSAALIVWTCRGYDEHTRKNDGHTNERERGRH